MIYTEKRHPHSLGLNTDFRGGFSKEDMLPAVRIFCTDGRSVSR